MDQVRQVQCSTKLAATSIPIVLPHDCVDSNMDPQPQQPSNKCTHHVFLTVLDVTGSIASNQTGRFPVTSNRGNAYVYIFDPNYIKSVPIRNHSKDELLRAYTKVYAWLTGRGYRPLLHKLDNETSRDIEALVAAKQVKIQYTPPDMHRTNPAERAVRTWKNHFTAGIAGIPPSFPIANWCRLTTQSDMMLNMYEAMDGSFSFDVTPLAPLGTEVLIHLKPSSRLTWGYHAAKAWYLLHATNHYRCIRVIMQDTGAERVTDTFRYQHHAIPVPHITTDRIITAARQLADAIQGVQEAPADEMAAIALLRFLLLGEALPPEPTPPADPDTVAHPDERPYDEPPNPMAIAATPAERRVSPHATVIHDDDPGQRTPSPINMPALPITLRHPARWHQNDRPPHARPVKQSQLRKRTTHMINCVIADTIASTQNRLAKPPPPAICYTFAINQLTSTEHRSATLGTQHFLGTIIDKETGKMGEYRHLIMNASTRKVWECSFSNEIGRLFRGIQNLKGTYTCFFIRKSQVPSDKRPTYGRIVCNFRPQKEEQHRTRLTVGGDRIDYPGTKATPTADLTTAKLLINSTISTPDVIFLGIDLSNIYLNTPMPNHEYM